MPNRITEARKLAGLSQRDLAARMGLKPSTVSGYESGTYDPKSDGLIKIATICGCTIDYLLGLVDTPTGNSAVQISDSDPQIDEIVAICKSITAQGLEYVRLSAEIISGNPKYQKKISPMPAKTGTGDRGRLAARGGVAAEQEHPADMDAFLQFIDESEPPEKV